MTKPRRSRLWRVSACHRVPTGAALLAGLFGPVMAATATTPGRGRPRRGAAVATSSKPETEQRITMLKTSLKISPTRIKGRRRPQV